MNGIKPGIIKPGTYVICDYRIPAEHQWWVHCIHVGQVMEPSTNLTQWNGRNSEADCCEATGTIPIRYKFGVMHDTALKLHPVDATEDFMMACSWPEEN